MIYFAQKQGSDLIKIGFSRNIRQRMYGLSNQLKSPVSAIKICEGELKDEKGLHKRFAELREHGEWFRPGEELMEFILSLPDMEIPLVGDDDKERMTLNLPPDLKRLAETEAKERFMSLTGFILYAIKKELGRND